MIDCEKYCDTLLGVFLPPIMVWRKRGCHREFAVCLILWLLVVTWPAAIIYAFHCTGYQNLCHNILCCFYPPIVCYIRFGCGYEFLWSFLLWFLLFVPSITFTYYRTW